MRYHFIVNGFLEDCERRMQEQAGFAKRYLGKMEAGEALLLCENEEKAARIEGRHAKEAVLLTAGRYVPEVFLDQIAEWMNPDDLYIFDSDDSGTELCVRSAVRAGGSSVTSVQEAGLVKGETPEDAAGGSMQQEVKRDVLQVEKMVYSNHMKGTFRMEKGAFCISLGKGMDRGELAKGSFSIVKRRACLEGAEHILSAEFIPEEAEKGLTDARVILAAGRGIKKKENLAVLERLAERIGGEVGVSRPAAMNAWAPMNQLIGVSGAMTAPDICIAAGVSGAAAFYAGIEKSKFIVAVNTDENAPIMKMTDVAVADDLIPVLEELERLISLRQAAGE